MKKILYLLLCGALIIRCLTGCSAELGYISSRENDTKTQEQTETQAEEQIKKLNNETVLRFYNLDTEKFNDEKQMSSIITTYLQEREMFKEKPDNIFYSGENYFVEYYTDSDKRKTSFIIHFNDSLSESRSVYCITFSWDDLKKIGNIVYDYNQNGDVLYENLYNIEGELTANVSYEYYENIPFPFIDEYEIADDSAYKILNRSQKFWFYKDFTDFNETGRIAGYEYGLQYAGSFYKSDINKFFYGEKGRLEAVKEIVSEQEKLDLGLGILSTTEFSTDITLDYHENGELSKIHYAFWHGNHGTWDSSGKIFYDEQGRMIYRDYYITHGYHYCVYLYEGQSKRPWAYIELCSMSYSGEDNYGYGNETYVYIFEENCRE